MLDRLFAAIRPRWYCPVCGDRVRRFQPLPAMYREQAEKYGYRHFGKGETINAESYSCPRCGAADRERLYALFLDRLPSLPPGAPRQRLLHVAPEPALACRIRRMGRFDSVTVDLEMSSVDQRLDVTRMPQFRDGAFDCFICSHVLEHVSDDRAALAELFRVLAPGGWGILMVPLMTHTEASLEDATATSEADRWRLFGQGDHVRLYAKADFLKRIGAAGFVVDPLDARHFGPEEFARAGIAPGSVLYIVRRPP